MINDLSLAFIEQRPLAAARALNALSVQDASAFLDSIPSRFAGRVLGAMSAWAASRMILAMASASAAGALRALPYLDAVAILRLVGSAERREIVTQMPRRLVRDINVTLSYPSDTVGGKMTLEIVAFGPLQTIADAHHALSKAPDVDTDVVFVMDEQRHYAGSVAVCALFRHGPATKLQDVSVDDLPAVAARQSLASVSALDAWQRSHYLPVIDRRRHLVGALSINELQSSSASMGPQTGGLAVGGSLIDEYFGTARALLALFSPGATGAKLDREST